jgi:hypothetical protein
MSANSKWIKVLNTSPETLGVRNTLGHIHISNSFLNRASMTDQLRESIEKCEYKKLKRSVQKKKWS